MPDKTVQENNTDSSQEVMRACSNEQQRIAEFYLPRFNEIPTVGLYLDQVTRYVNEYLQKAGCAEITASMVSNYVKHHIIPGPDKKFYHADSIACLMFVSFIKTVVSLEDIRHLLSIQQETCEFKVAYNYFCDEFENLLQVVFGLKETADRIGGPETLEKSLLRAAILSLATRIYVGRLLNSIYDN